jgi:hypothetical protein
VEGEAFGKGPAKGSLPRQGPIGGIQGEGLLNSYHGGDGSKGRVVLPPFELGREPIHLLVAGGKRCNETYVGLEVDGAIVARACGRGDEQLRPATLLAPRHAGQIAQIVVVDESAGPWGHILVDDVIMLHPPSGDVQLVEGARPVTPPQKSALRRPPGAGRHQ